MSRNQEIIEGILARAQLGPLSDADWDIFEANQDPLTKCKPRGVESGVITVRGTLTARLPDNCKGKPAPKRGAS